MGEKHPMIEQIPQTQWPHCAWDQISQKSIEKQMWVCIRMIYKIVSVEQSNTWEEKISLRSKHPKQLWIL